MRRAAALAVALALVAAGCGHGNPRHDDVAQYIASVNTLEMKLATPLLEISKANRDFAKRKGTPASIAKRLRTQADKVDVLAAKLDAIPAPSDARKLRPMVVELAHRESALAREVASLAIFLPAFSDALKPLTTIGAPLKAALKSKAKPDVKASALDTYAASVDGVIVQLRKLDPPAVTEAAYANQLHALQDVRTTAAALATALRAKDSKALPKLLDRFNAAAAGNQTIAAQRAQIDAIKAYDARIRSLNVLSGRVHNEERRLRRLLD